MDIYLQDLGRRRQTAVLHWRVSALNRTSEGSLISLRPASVGGEAAPRPGWLGRLWAHNVDSPPEVAAAGLSLLRGQNHSMIYGMFGGSLGLWMPALGLAASGQHGIAAGMACMGIAMSGVGLCVPGYWLRRVCRPPLSAEEVTALHAAASDELEQAYLRLVENAVRQGVTPEAADQVRAALRAVGEAIDQLPAVAVPRASVDTLRAEAERAQEEARAEPDPVVAASYERRAEALARSASAAQRSQMLMRRAAALREEMMAQIESLRLGLTGFETASGDVSNLASLADAVRVVAEESVSIADARTELDASLPGAPATETLPKLPVGTV